jgi:hypothetical protein
VFFVRSAEVHHCPVCENGLYVIGSRVRKGRKPTGEKVSYVIRRLRCTSCQRIHHELPDLFIPYKHYEVSCLEEVLTQGKMSDVAADESTLYRWSVWFAQIWLYWVGCLQSIATRFGLAVEGLSVSSPSALQQIGRYVGDDRGWLKRLVRPIVHAHLWVHTQFAFLSKNS